MNLGVAQAPRGAGCLAGFRIGRFTGLRLTGLGVGCFLAAADSAGAASVPERWEVFALLTSVGFGTGFAVGFFTGATVGFGAGAGVGLGTGCCVGAGTAARGTNTGAGVAATGVGVGCGTGTGCGPGTETG